MIYGICNNPPLSRSLLVLYLKACRINFRYYKDEEFNEEEEE